MAKCAVCRCTFYDHTYDDPGEPCACGQRWNIHDVDDDDLQERAEIERQRLEWLERIGDSQP